MRFMCICMAFVSCLSFTSAWAAEETSNKVAAEKASNNVLDKRITVYGGVQIYQAQGDFSSSKEGRPDFKVDLGDLDLKENEVSPVVGAIFNFGKRWNLRFNYFGYHDDAKKTTDFSFEFDDVIYPSGARVDSSLDLDIYVLSLEYNFIHTERARLGVGIGVHVADLDLKISGKVTVDGEETSLDPTEEDFIAPFPNLSAYGAYAFTERFIARFGGGWMSLSYDNYDGSLYFASASLEYWPFQYVGFGLGYRYISVDVDYEPGNKKETYDVKLPGPMFYLTAGF